MAVAATSTTFTWHLDEHILFRNFDQTLQRTAVHVDSVSAVWRLEFSPSAYRLIRNVYFNLKDEYVVHDDCCVHLSFRVALYPISHSMQSLSPFTVNGTIPFKCLKLCDALASFCIHRMQQCNKKLIIAFSGSRFNTPSRSFFFLLVSLALSQSRRSLRTLLASFTQFLTRSFVFGMSFQQVYC